MARSKKTEEPAEDERPQVPMPPEEGLAGIDIATIVDRIPMNQAAANVICKGITDPKKQAFLLALAQLGNRTRAARAVGVSTVVTWHWRQVDPVFAQRYEEAMEMSADVMEDEVFRRGTEGVLEPVFQGGQLVGSVRRYSDTLLIFGLKGIRPDKYRDNYKVEHTGGIDIVARLRGARQRAIKK